VTDRDHLQEEINRLDGVKIEALIWDAIKGRL